MTATPQQLPLPFSAVADRRALLARLRVLERRARAADARGQWQWAAKLRGQIAAEVLRIYRSGGK